MLLLPGPWPTLPCDAAHDRPRPPCVRRPAANKPLCGVDAGTTTVTVATGVVVAADGGGVQLSDVTIPV